MTNMLTTSPSTTKYFIYARKSTQGDRRQMLSIPAQLDELHKFVKMHGLSVVAEITERQSAMTPGRPEFNRMMQRIEAGDASGIIAWHPDRLARNSMDGGAIIYFLDTAKLVDLKFPTFWFENTPQGKSNLGHEFVQTKQFSDKLADDTQRGLEKKARMGIYPSIAPFGYLNDKATKTIVLDPGLAPIAKAAYEAYAVGDKTLDAMQAFFAARGVLSKKRNRKAKGGLLVHHDWIRRFLRNPFYYGHFEYAGELYEGKHPPIVTKRLFDDVRVALERRTHHIPKEREPKPFAGLLRCGECGMAITAEVQKGHTYYRCTKKSKVHRCSQKFTREGVLDRELSALMRPFTLPTDWTEEMLALMAKEERDSAQSACRLTEEKQAEIAEVQACLDRLIAIYIAQEIDRDSFLPQKEELLARKKLLQEQMRKSERCQNAWLEPFREWVKAAKNTANIADSGSLTEKKAHAQKIFGSNLFLDSKKARGEASKPWSFLTEPSSLVEMVLPPGIEPGSAA